MRSVLFTLLLAAPALAARAPVPVPASALLIRQETPVISWRWRAAPEVGAQPALLRVMRAEALAAAGKARAAAARDAAGAKAAGIPFRAHDSVQDWSLAADTPHLLALAGETYAFTGGAHGNTGFAARIWDKTAKRQIGIEALFSDWPRAIKLIEPLFCRALAEEQARRRQGQGQGQGQAGAGDFASCPKLSEQPVVPYAGLGRRAGQFRVLLGPYVAGPYAEGSYLVTAPWPEAARPLVKAAFRGDLFGDAG